MQFLIDRTLLDLRLSSWSYSFFVPLLLPSNPLTHPCHRIPQPSRSVCFGETTKWKRKGHSRRKKSGTRGAARRPASKHNICCFFIVQAARKRFHESFECPITGIKFTSLDCDRDTRRLLRITSKGTAECRRGGSRSVVEVNILFNQFRSRIPALLSSVDACVSIFPHEFMFCWEGIVCSRKLIKVCICSRLV